MSGWGGLSCFQQFYTLASLPSNGGLLRRSRRGREGPRVFPPPSCSVICLLLSHANTKATLKPRHLAWIRRGLSEPYKMSAGHPSFLGVVTMATAHLTAAAHNGTLRRDRDERRSGRCRRQTGGRRRWMISPLRREPRREKMMRLMKDAVRGDEMRKYHKEQRRHV